MGQIKSISEIKEGMILAEPIINNFGQMLIPAGTELNLNHIRLLKIWNIQNVRIKSFNEELESINPEIKLIAAERLKKKLKWEPRNQLEQDLIQMAILHRVNKIVNSTGND